MTIFDVDHHLATNFACKHCCAAPVQSGDKCTPPPICDSILPLRDYGASWRAWLSYLPYAAGAAIAAYAAGSCFTGMRKRARTAAQKWEEESESSGSEAASPRGRVGR